MNIKDEALKQFRARRPFQEVRTNTRSKSQLYEGLRQFLDEVEATFEEQQEKLRKAEEQRSNFDAHAKSLRAEIERLQEEKRRLEQETASLNNEVSEKAGELSSLQERMDGFQEKGFTPEIVRKLESMVERGGGTLLKQVENVEEYHGAMKDFSCLRKSTACLLKEVRTLKHKKKQAQDSVVSITNRIDELKLHVRPLKDAVNAVVCLLQKGYTVEDIRSLGYGLDFLGVEGDPDLSISRLVAGLKRQKSQSILAEKVTRKRHELARSIDHD